MRTSTRLACALAMVASVSAACGEHPEDPPPRPPDARAELEASRKAMLEVTRFTMDSTSTTKMGTFRTTFQVDCAPGYYHKLHTVDLTPEGVERGTSQFQGRPRAHRVSEELHVDGRSYTRYSGSWESPRPETDDAEPDWTPSRSSFAERADCERIRQERDLLTVPYSKMRTATAIDFVGRAAAGGVPCNEFRLAYVETVYGDRMIEKDATTKERERVQQPVEARICIGLDHRLAYRVQQVDEERVPVTRQFSYGEITRLPAPGLP